MVNRYDASKFVIPLGHQVDMAPLYYATDTLLIGSQYGEAQPLVLFEAMAYGIPVIATDVGSIAKILDGLVKTLPLGDDQRFMQTCSDAATGQWSGLVVPQAKLRQRVEDHHSITRYIQNLDNIIETRPVPHAA